MTRPALMLNSALAVLLASAAQAATIEVPALIYRPADAAGSGAAPSSDDRGAASTDLSASAIPEPLTIRTSQLRYRPATATSPGETAERAVTEDHPTPPPGNPITIRTPGLSYRIGTPTALADSPVVVRAQPLRYRADQAPAAAALMEYVEFPAESVSSPHLHIDTPLTGTGEPLVVHYSGLDPERRHVLFAWNLLKNPRIMAQHRTRAGETTGTWSPMLTAAGTYKICMADDERSLEARRAPERADECVTSTVVWGDPAQPPRPVIAVEPAEPIAPGDFVLRYSSMPESENAKIFIHQAGAETYAMPELTIATYGKTSDSVEPRIWQPGHYEIRVVYEMQARQTRAVRPLRVLPREQEPTR